MFIVEQIFCCVWLISIWDFFIVPHCTSRSKTGISALSLLIILVSFLFFLPQLFLSWPWCSVFGL